MHSTLAAAMVPVCHCILCPPYHGNARWMANDIPHHTKETGFRSPSYNSAPGAAWFLLLLQVTKKKWPANQSASGLPGVPNVKTAPARNLGCQFNSRFRFSRLHARKFRILQQFFQLHVDEVLQSWMTIITSILEALDFLCVVTLECSCCNMQRTDLAGPKVAEADPVSHQPPETIAGTIVEFSQTSFGCHFKQTRLR